MPAPVRQQALTAIIPVRADRSDALDAFLEAWREEIVARLVAITSLHTAQIALIPASDRPGTAVSAGAWLLFETTFDGELPAHLSEWWWLLAEELDALFAHCADWVQASDERGFERYLRVHERTASAWCFAHPGLSVSRIQADARLRATLSRHLRDERALLAGQPALAVARHVRYLLERDAEREEFDFEVIEGWSRPAAEELRASAWRVAREHAFELVPLLVRSCVHEVSDWLQALWNDTKLDAPADEARLDRIEGLEQPTRQNGFLHVVEPKPGSFRRQALRSGLRFVHELLRRVPALVQRARSGLGHSSRWVLLEDGRLLFSSAYDGAGEGYLGELVERASAWFNLIGSHTWHFPVTFGFLLGGARCEQGFKRWARTGQVVTPIWYSAYPELAVRDVLAAAELRELLAAELEPAGAARVLELA